MVGLAGAHACTQTAEDRRAPNTLSLYIITIGWHYRWHPTLCQHVNTLRILHAAYDATNTTCPLVNTDSVR